MSRLTCPRGHQWQTPPASASATVPTVCPVCGATPTAAAQVTPGRADTMPAGGAQVATAVVPRISVPGYDILSELGRGGMGVVYKARQLKLNRLVALKMVLAGAHAGAHELARFKAEAEAVARLQHPHIVQVYEVGEHDGRPYFSLEFVPGGSLAQKLKGDPLPAEQAARMIQTLATAVEYAHQQGIVHRDLKPANVLIAPDGAPKVTDFGLAKQVGSQAQDTKTGAALGTPSYMAPEQALGKNKEVGPAADIYALGSVLYELLTGRPPFRSETPLETMLQVASEEPVPPSRLRAKVPRDLETICLKCLEKEPRKRYVSAAALAEDLTRFLNNDAILARPIGPLERVGKWARRRPALAGLVFLVLGISVLAFFLVSWQWGRAELARRDAAARAVTEAQARRDAEEQGNKARQALAQSERAQYFQRIALADREYEAGNVGRARQLLDDCPPAMRHWEWHYLSRLCQSEQRVFRGHSKGISAVAISPDGSRIASAGWTQPDQRQLRTEVKIWEADSGRVLHTLPADNYFISRLAWVGATLATLGQDGTVSLWDANTGKRLQTLRAGTGARGLALSPDGRRLAAASSDGVRLWELPGGKELPRLPWPERSSAVLAFSDDGQRLAAAGQAGGKGLARVWDASGRDLLTLHGEQRFAAAAFGPQGTLALGMGSLIKLYDASGKELQRLRGHKGEVTTLTFSRDGQRLYSGSVDRTILVWDPAAGQELFALRGHEAHVTGLALSPDGRRLASSSYDETVRLWNATRGPEAAHLAEGAPGRGVAYSPDGRWLAVGGNTLRLWDRAAGKLVATLGGPADIAQLLAFSPDSRRLVSGGARVKVWEIPSGRQLAVTPYADGNLTCTAVAFSPDGRHAAASFGTYDPQVAGLVKIWDAASGQEVRSWSGPPGGVAAVAYSPDGQRLATAHENGAVLLWEATTGKQAGTLRAAGNVLRTLAFSPDGRFVAAAGGAYELAGLGGSSADVDIRVWDVPGGRETAVLRGHTGPVHTLAFHPDSRRLASAGNDQTVRLWDLGSGQELLALRGPQRPVESIAFSADGRFLAASSSEAFVRQWNGTPP